MITRILVVDYEPGHVRATFDLRSSLAGTIKLTSANSLRRSHGEQREAEL